MNDFEECAIALAQRGFPMPNPRVGCTLVREGVLVGEGWHEAAGQPHAEAMALAAAGDAARGATCYVTLEPCNHHGRTPPCAQALIAAGVVRVVIGVMDPNPVASGGAKALQEAGIVVEQHEDFTQASEQVNAAWLTAMRKKRPFVLLKAAVTLDGFMARPDGSSKWITSDLARERARLLRAEMGAVMVGSGTVLADDPMLTVRSELVTNPPVRVVLDTHRALPEGLHVWDDAAPTLRLVSEPAAQPGDMPVPIGPDGRLDPAAALSALWQQGIRGVLVEGGPTLIEAMLDAGLYDRIALFVGAKVFDEGRKPEGLMATISHMKPVLSAVHGDSWELHFQKVL